jgi:A/G-specific adenine glycosylase
MSDHSPPTPAAEPLRLLRQALLDHYDVHARVLPWRDEEDPYRIWVSEVMLQQTRVATVLRYYEPWLERFPHLEDLAAAELDDVLLAWEGLGYYRRARFLHAGARMVRDELGGEVPSTYEGLRALPGLGEYAAGAVASIAFGRVVPAVDGNVRRVLARLFDEPSPTRSWLRSQAEELVAPERPGDWNQALMELGATVCTPTAPACGTCPVARWCAARAAGTQEERPAPKKPGRVRGRAFATAVVVDEHGRALVTRRPEEGLLGGLWTFPDTVLDGWDDATAAARAAAVEAGAVLEERARADGAGADLPLTLSPVRHRFTHLDATYRPVLLAGRPDGHEADEHRWVELEDPGVALPVAQQKIARAAQTALGRGPLPLLRPEGGGPESPTGPGGAAASG